MENERDRQTEGTETAIIMWNHIQNAEMLSTRTVKRGKPLD